VKVTLVVDAMRAPPGGIGRYTRELAQRLPHQPDIDELLFFDDGRFVDDPAQLVRGDRTRSKWLLPRWLGKRLVGARLASTLVHGPNYFLPAEADSGVVTVHDLSVFKYPETHPPERLRSFERHFTRSLSMAQHVIVDTETVRRELIDEFSVAPELVTAIPLGVDERYHPRPDDALIGTLSSWGLRPGGYALCVSALEPRKRVDELLRAWQALPPQTRSATPLVLAGSGGWLNAGIHERIEQGVADGWLKHLGFVPEEQLPELYAGAALFLYPSIYEGFGLPPLEAMASGVPVLVSNRSCMPEICGDAAGYVDPDDQAGFVDRIAAALADEDWRSRSQAAGPLRAGAFTWDKCASRTVNVYRQVR